MSRPAPRRPRPAATGLAAFGLAALLCACAGGPAGSGPSGASGKADLPTLSDATAQKPTFTAPEAPGSLKFTVTVTDTQNPNPSTASTTSGPVQIDVQDYAAPIADAGPNQSNIDIGTTSNVDGPLVGYQVIIGQSVTTSFPSITIVPNGMPANPTAYAQIDPPSGYSG